MDRPDLFDLHIDSFIWTRILRYDLHRRHGRSITGRRFAWQVDLPRAHDAGLAGGIWSITTNPFRSARSRREAFVKNLRRLRATLEADPKTSVVRNAREYHEARRAGRHGAFIGIQGGNALGPDDLHLLGGDVIRVTLVHLTSSGIGTTSSPLSRLSRRAPLSQDGRRYVEALDDARVLVDLAHISEPGFWAAVDAHDSSLPLIVTHTGVDGVHPHWRNLTDDQIRAVADTGGCVGVMLHETFLGRPSSVETVVDHLDHIVKVGGEAAPAIGTDYDGMVTPPADLPDYRSFPALLAAMERRGWSEERIRAAFAGNAVRVIEAIRP